MLFNNSLFCTGGKLIFALSSDSVNIILIPFDATDGVPEPLETILL